MKRPTNFTITNFILQRALFFLVLAGAWYTRLGSEGKAIAFSTDSFRSEWMKTIAEPVLPLLNDSFFGPLTLAFLSLTILLACDVIIWQLFKYRRMQCLSFLPAAWITIQYVGSPCSYYLFWALLLSVVALVLFVITYKKRFITFSFDSKALLFITNILPFAIIALTAIAIA